MSVHVGSTMEDPTLAIGPDGDAAAILAGGTANAVSSSSETPSPGEDSVASGATDGDDGDDTSGYWLLCAVICSGKGLYVGEGQIGDLFCMLHTSDGVCRSRTAVTGMVYSNANPSWPSNGNGNAFVLPVRRSKRQTDLVITVWDGSESLEEAIPVGKVHVNLQDFMQYRSVPPGKDIRDDAPPRYDFDVDLVPRLSALSSSPAQLTVMLERASPVFEGDGAKDQALHDLLRRLGISRKRERLKKLMQWDREYTGNSMARGAAGGSQNRDYSLVSLLTADPGVGDNGGNGEAERDREGGTVPLQIPNGGNGKAGLDGEGDGWGLHDNKAQLEEVMAQLSRSWGGGGDCGGSCCPMKSVPVRAQAALAARIKYVTLQDGCLVMEKGNAPTSFFYIVRGSCLVTVGGEEVNRLEAGQFLGEVGVIYESARIADVRAIGDTEVLVLNGNDLSLALDMFPGLYHELKKVAEMRFEHIQSRQSRTATAAELKRPVVDSHKDGPLSQFLAFLNTVAQESGKDSMKSLASDGHTRHPNSIINNAYNPQAVKSIEEIIKLDSINEGEVKTHMSASAHNAHMYEQALSARLASMEQSGAFGEAVSTGVNGIKIPGRRTRTNTSPTHGSSLRVALFSNVGSLEHARAAGAGEALSPYGNRWDRMSSSWSGSDIDEMSGYGSDSEPGGRTDDMAGEGGEGGRRASLSGTAAGSSGSYTGSPSKDGGGDSGSGAEGADGVQAGVASLQVNERAHASQAGVELGASRPRQVGEQKKGRTKAREGQRRPRPRKNMFRIRFRKAHDTYTAEELGATPRRLRRVTLSGVYVQNLKEHDIQSYFTIEASTPPGETAREPLLQSDVVRGDKVQQEVAWSGLVTMDIEDDLLFSDERLCFSVFQKRHLWSTRVIGYAFVSLKDAFSRPGVSMQSTFQLFKDKDEAERRSRDKVPDGADSMAKGGPAAPPQATMPRTWSGGTLFRRGSRTEVQDDEGGGKVRGHVTMTWLVEDTIKLPFCLSVPPLRPGQCHYDVTDLLGVVVAKLEYLGRSKCAWCTNIDPKAAVYSDYTDAESGPHEDACCNACSMKGWSECVVMWDKTGAVRLGSVFTDVTPRKHARARICDQNDTHFASVRAACKAKPEISTAVRFKIVPTFSELSIKACGTIISGKTCSSSFQVAERRPDMDESKDANGSRRARGSSSRVGDVVADINRGGAARDPANVLVQAGKDAVRSVLIAIGIDEACRLRPRAGYEGVTFKDKFDKEYQREDEETSGVRDDAASHPSPHGSPFQSPR